VRSGDGVRVVLDGGVIGWLPWDALLDLVPSGGFWWLSLCCRTRLGVVLGSTPFPDAMLDQAVVSPDFLRLTPQYEEHTL
jgi:hypothetical protein